MTLISSRDEKDIVDYMRMLERRLARLERGSQGSSGGDDSTVITSLAITGLTLSTQTIIGADDYYRVMMRYSWTAVPDDPSEYNKDRLDGYLTSWSIDGTHYTAERFTTDTSVDAGPFTQGQSVTFRVRAQTVKGTRGAYSTNTTSTTTDATAPFQPSTPVVAPYLGQLAIDWNGLDVSAAQPPTDFRFCEVHISTTGSTFTPTVSTLVGTILRGGGTWVATGLTYGTLYYSRLVAVDTVGNRSPASTAGSGTPVQAANGDISSLAVGKLTAGVITAVMTITGRLATALTGARVEMNVNGIQAFNSGGGQTVDVAASTGAVTITGNFKTAFAGGGTPYLDITDSTDRTTMAFWNSAGTINAFINSPQISGSPSLGMNSGSFTYATSPSTANASHRLWLSNASGMFLETNGASGKVGGRLVLASNSIDLAQYNGTGNVQDGGYVDISTSQAKLKVTNTGTVAAEVAMFDDATIWVTGTWSQDNPIGGKSALFAGVWNVVNMSGGSTVSYGVTMATAPRVFYGIQKGTPITTTVGEYRCTDQSTTSFTMQSGNSTNVNLTYWCVRLA
jgi:hypothetical protein